LSPALAGPRSPSSAYGLSRETAIPIAVFSLDREKEIRTYTKNPEAVSKLSPEQYRVTQQSGTESPGAGEYLDNKEPGIYVADAAAWLAETDESQGEFGFVAPAVAFEQARGAATNALKLDSKNARSHCVLGLIHVAYDWD
jgi:hypothetical protein